MKLVVVGVLALASACSSKSPAPASPPAAPAAAAPAIAYDQLVAATDRSEGDRKIDGSRKPVDTLAFFGVKPGMHVADLGAGGGYTSELLARAVGPNGHVIAHDSPTWDGDWLQKAWKERTAKPVMANSTHVLRAWNDPLPPGTQDLDAVYFVCAYHDVIAEKGDSNQLARAVFASLKHGGVFVVIDNSAKDGTGGGDSERFHRIDEKLVRDEVTRAGFQLAATADFLRNPGDTRDWNADPSSKDPRARTQDRFVLKFVKP
jgi:predicted methyltransferase